MGPTPSEASVGVDVSEAELDVAAGEAPVFTVANTPKGHAELVARPAPSRPRRVVLQATGGLEGAVAAAPCRVGLPVPVVDPRQARDFAKAMGYPAQADAIDARAPAHFAAATEAEPEPLPEEAARELDASLDRRRRRIGMRTMEQDRWATAAGRVRRDVESHPRWLREHIRQVEREPDERIRRSTAWWEKDNLLGGIPGVGPVLSRTPLAGVPERGTLSDRRAAAPVGVGPMAHDSGRRRGPRRIAGGRESVRRVPSMAAVTASRSDAAWERFADR